MASVQSYQTIQQMYVAYYQRPGDPSGMQYWATYLEQPGSTLEQVENAFGNSAEALRIYGPIDSSTIATVVNQMYQWMFGRDAEQAGLDFYVGEFNAGRISAAGIAYSILVGARGNDAVTVSNKLLGANQFSQIVDGHSYGDPLFGIGTVFNATYAGAADAAQASSFVKAITSSPTTVPSPPETTNFIKTNIANPGDPILATVTQQLTTGIDNLQILTSNVVVQGLGDPVSGTYTTGDTINGNATTTLALVLNGAAGLGTVTNVGTSTVNLLANTSLNTALWTGVGKVDVNQALNGTTLTVTGGDIATTYALDAANKQTNLTVGFLNTSGSADTAKLSVGSTGVSTSARSAIDVSSSNTVEGISLTTEGSNFASLAGGTKAAKVTIDGAGANDISFGTLATNITVDGSTTTGTQKYTFQAGTLDSNDTVKTGSATNDTVTSNSSLTFAKMTGVENFVTTVDGGVSLYNGDNVSGLKTMTINQGSAAGSTLFTNMKAEFTTLNVNGPTGSHDINYVAGADANLTINFGPGDTAYDSTFDGVSVSNVKDLAINFNVGGVAGVNLGTGPVTLDKNDTQTLSLIQNGSDDAVYVDLKRGDALQSLIIKAAGDNSTMAVSSVDFFKQYNAPDVQGLQHLEITASGASSSAWLNDWGNINYTLNGSGSTTTLSSYTDAMALTDLAITASGDGSEAYLNTYLVTIGDMTSLKVMATGSDSSAFLNYTAIISGNVGEFDLIASGNDAYAYASSDVYIWGDVGAINVVASGASSEAYFDSALYVFGNVDGIKLQASGYNSSAWADTILITGDVGTIQAIASGESASAGAYNVSVSGDLTEVDLIASGDYSSAYMELSYVGGDLGTFKILASGQESSAYLYTTCYVSGDLGALVVTASGDTSDASFDGYNMYVAGNVGSIALTASGAEASATATVYVSGNVGTYSGVASGAYSEVYGYLYNNDGDMSVSQVTVTASGVNSTSYLSVDTGNGALGAVAISATKANADATLYFTGNTFGTIAANTASPSASIYMDLNNTVTKGGVITVTGSGTTHIDIAGKSITSLTGSAATNTITVHVFNPGTATAGMTLTTGSGQDWVQGGNGVDTFNLGGGADTFDFSNLTIANNTAPGSMAVTDIIAGGFASGTDKIEFGGAAGSGTNYAENLTAAASLSALITAADTALNGTVQYYFGVVAGNGYLFYDADGTGLTDMVQITGVTDMAAADII